MNEKNSRDNIQVSIRIKPLLEDGRPCIKLDSNLKNTIIIEGNQLQDQKYFYFDYVAPQDASQDDIFEIVGKQQAINCLDGYNGCVFVYGQTGSGKTYTMMGTQKQPGLLPKVVDFLFECIRKEQKDITDSIEYLVKCSYLEIYNEHIIDLLNPQLGNLQLREDLKRGVYVEQLTEEVCQNEAESLEVLQRGSLNRHISSTQMNIESSRSHSVFTIQLESRRQSSQTQVINHRFSRFHFVDLAGSERQKQSQAQGERLREGCNINRSLHILGNVINSLVEDTQSYVHYRDSKLTFLLKDSLGGNSRTHLIANIQQSSLFYQETLSTLLFSKRVKQVKNKARINEDESGNLESLKNEIKRLKQELAKTVASQIIESPKKNFESKQLNDQFLQSLELDTIQINDQKYIKLEEILKCYLEQSTESETALFLEIEKYLSSIKQLREGFQLGQQMEQQLKLVIKLQNEQISKLKQNQNIDDTSSQIQQQLSQALQYQGLIMKTFNENLQLREQQGCTVTVSKAQIQIDSNITLLKDIIETVQNSLNERRQFQQQIDEQFNQTYMPMEKYKQLESESQYKDKLLSEQTQKLVIIEQQIQENEKQFLIELSEQGITFDENKNFLDIRDKQIIDLKKRINDLGNELKIQTQELENVLNNSEAIISDLKQDKNELKNQIEQNQQNYQTKLIEQQQEQEKQIEQQNCQNQNNIQQLSIEYQQQLTKEQNNNLDLLQKVSEQEIIIQELNLKIIDQNTSIQNLTQYIKQLEETQKTILDEKNKLENNNKEIVTQYEILQKDFNTIQIQLKYQSSQSENSEQELIQTIAKLEQENIAKISNFQDFNSNLQNQLQQLQQELVLHQNEQIEQQENSQIQINELEQLIQQQQNQIATMEQSHLEQLKQQKKDFEILQQQTQQQYQLEKEDLKQKIIQIENQYSNDTNSFQSQITKQMHEIEYLQKQYSIATETQQGIENEMQSNLELLHKQLESKQAVIQETSEHYNQVHELYLSLQTRNEQKDILVEDLKKKNDEQSDYILQLEKQINSLNVENDSNQSKATQQQGKLQDIGQKLQNKMKLIEQLQQDKTQIGDKLRELECELNKFKLVNSNMELQLSEQEKLISALQSQSQSLKNQIQEEKLQYQSLQQELTQQNQILDKSSEIWKNETDQLEQENKQLKQLITEKSKDINKLDQQLQQLQNSNLQQLTNLQQQNNSNQQDLQNQIDELNDENQTLHNQLSEVNEQTSQIINDLKTELEQKTIQLDENKQNVKKLTKQLELEIKQYGSHMKKYEDQHKKEIQEFVDQLDIQSKQFSQKNQQYDNLCKQMKGISEEKGQIEKELQNLKERYKADHSKFNKLIQGLEAANIQLKTQLDEQNKINQEIQLKIQQNQKQSDQYGIQQQEHQEKYNLLKDQLTRLESQMKQESQIREQYSHIADKVTKENNDLKQRLEKKQQVINQLEQSLLQNEDTLKNVHDRAKEFCKQQEKEINDIKDQYLKLEAEHNAILSQNQEREDENEQIKDQKDQALIQMQYLEEELVKSKREVQEQHEKLTKANNERQMLYKQIEEMQRDIAQLGGHNNPSQKIRYLNTIKQENSCLKQEKLYLSEQLQKEIEEKNKLLKDQQDIQKLDNQKLTLENSRLNSEMAKLNQVLNLSGVKNRFSTIKGSDGDKILQSVQMLIQELVDCKQELQQRTKEQEGRNLKYQSMEKDLLVMKQKYYAKDQGQPKNQSPQVQTDILRDNNRINSVQRQSKPKHQQTFQFQ